MKRTTKADTTTTTTPQMDPTMRNEVQPTTVVITGREAYAITTLADEVTAIFPQVSYETSDPDDWGIRLAAEFEPLDAQTASVLPDLLSLIDADPRVASVIEGGGDKTGSVLVTLVGGALSRDTRDSFGLAGAWAIATGAETGDDQ